MDFELSAEQVALRDAARRFVREHAPLAWVRERYHAREDHLNREVWQQAVSLGLVGLLPHKLYGGSNLGMVEVGVVAEELGAGLHTGPWLASAVAATSALIAAARPGEQAELLTALASGKAITTLAHDERRPHAWCLPATLAVPDRLGWWLRGQKALVLDVSAADFLLVTARAHDGPGLFLVEIPAKKQVVVQPLPITDGSRDVSLLAFERARARRLDYDEDMVPALLDAQARFALAVVADAIGAARAALELAVEHARNHERSGRPLGSFQAVAHLCADMLVDVELCRTALWGALWTADHRGHTDALRAATFARSFATEALPRVTARALEVHGGAGLAWEHDVHLFHKRVLSAQQLLGGAGPSLDAVAAVTFQPPTGW